MTNQMASKLFLSRAIFSLVALTVISCSRQASNLTLIGSNPPLIIPEISSWTAVDGSGVNGKNYDITKNATAPKTIVLGTKLYLIWSEVNGAAISQIRVAVYNGNDSSPGWIFVDGNGINGINKDSSRAVATPVATVFNSKLYISWSENNAGAVSQIRVAVYNGNDSSPGWIFVDGNGANGLNKNTTLTAAFSHLMVFNGKLYLTWQENTVGAVAQVRAAVYNGNDSAPSWTFIDGNGANGLNKNVGLQATSSVFGVLGSSLYLAWSERNAGSVFQTRVAVYNGNDFAPSWTFIDGNGANGLNKLTTSPAKIPYFITFNSKLYLFWREVNASAVTQLRATVYNGNDFAPSWAFIDGNGADGLNIDVTRLMTEFSLTIANSKLYVCWLEQNGSTISQVRVKVYNSNDSSPAWTVLDGNGVNGINKNAANAAGTLSCTAFQSALYAAWSEGTPGQLMLSVGK